jgi:hypothetical protein
VSYHFRPNWFWAVETKLAAMSDLEDVHRLLDDVEAVIQNLKAEPREAIDVLQDAGDLCLIVGEVVGWSTAYSDGSKRLGISAPLLSKFVKMKGRIRTRDALVVADRIRSHLRSLDQTSSVAVTPPANSQSGPEIRRTALTFTAERWIAVPAASQIKGKIATIAALLDNIIEQAARSNLPEDQQILTAIERQQLIAILETALNVLKSPLTEKTLLRKASDELKTIAKRSVEQGVQTGLGRLAGIASGKIVDLVKSLF